MGFFFTLLYIFVAYVTPVAIFGPYAGDYHVEEILAFPTIVCSIFALQGSGITRLNQTYAAIGLLFAVLVSVLLTGWLGGTVNALFNFLPNLLCFFFVAINCKKKWHLQAIVAILFAVALFVIIQSQIGEETFNRSGDYFLSMRNDAGQGFYRIRGLGVINDPNDFAQYMLATLPCLFLFWKKGNRFFNVVLVYVPAAVLLYGLYLTHSRGAMLALAVMCLVAGRRKLGTVPSLVASGVLLLGMMAGGFAGGRDVSAASGEDRMAAWGAGIEMLKAHPIFGIGANLFTEHYTLTAHNSIIICAAETGFVGLFFWTLFVFSSLHESWIVSQFDRKKEKEADNAIDASTPARLAPQHAAGNFARFQFAGPELAVQGMDPAILHRTRDDAGSAPYLQTSTFQVAAAPTFDAPRSIVPMPEVRRMATLMVVSLVGFLAAGWFLSRAYAMLLFIFGGMATVILKIAQENGMDVRDVPLGRSAKWAIWVAIGLVTTVYLTLRINNLLGRG